jgi:primosomal protein N' (replication factor Y)
VNILPPDCEITPVEAPGYAKVKAHHRVQFFLKGPRMIPLTCAINQISQNYPLDRGIKMLIDVNPLSTYF